MTRPHPLIGITGNFGEKGCELAEGYYLSVVRAGGTPVAIPPHNDKEALVTLLETLDGINSIVSAPKGTSRNSSSLAKPSIDKYRCWASAAAYK